MSIKKAPSTVWHQNEEKKNGDQDKSWRDAVDDGGRTK